MYTVQVAIYMICEHNLTRVVWSPILLLPQWLHVITTVARVRMKQSLPSCCLSDYSLSCCLTTKDLSPRLHAMHIHIVHRIHLLGNCVQHTLGTCAVYTHCDMAQHLVTVTYMCIKIYTYF